MSPKKALIVTPVIVLLETFRCLAVTVAILVTMVIFPFLFVQRPVSGSARPSRNRRARRGPRGTARTHIAVRRILSPRDHLGHERPGPVCA